MSENQSSSDRIIRSRLFSKQTRTCQHRFSRLLSPISSRNLNPSLSLTIPWLVPPFSFPCSDGDPEEAREQELSGLHGALQGEQVSERKERLWHHPFLPRYELPLWGQDDHPQGQTEHGQRLDAALNTNPADQSCPAPPPLSYCCIQGDECLSAHTYSTNTLGTALFPPFSLCVKLRTLDKRQSNPRLYYFIMCPYSSVFGSLGWTHGHIKDTATLGSALKWRRTQPERLLCLNQNLTVNIVILLHIIASFETGTLRQ